MQIFIDLEDNQERSNYIKFMEEVFSTSFHLVRLLKTRKPIYCYKSKDSKLDICWIRCENFNAIKILTSEKISEKSIYLITCTPQKVIQETRKKQVFNLYKNFHIPANFNENDFMQVKNGKSFGMDFNPAPCELTLFRLNTVHNNAISLKHSFKKIYPLLESWFYG